MRSSLLPASAPLVRPLLLLVLLGLLPTASAQNFDANRYYQQCLRFEAGGDFETARQSCLNALQVRPAFTDAKLALARVDLRLGNYASAETSLQDVRRQIVGPEPLILLAELTLATDRLAESEGYLQSARQLLQQEFNLDLVGRLNFLSGRLEERRGRVDEALLAYQQAVTADGLNVEYRLADASLRHRMGDLANARGQLLTYQTLSGDQRNAQVQSQLGRIAWSLGDLDEAASYLNTALALRSGRQTQAQAADWRALALVYYGQGDIQSGELALREATRRGNLVTTFLSHNILWLLLLLVVVAVHLVGESRIANSSGLEVIEGPQLWSVGRVYGILFVSLALGLVASLAYSALVLGNVLALVTPVQATDARAVFFGATSLLLALLAWRQVQRNGWDAYDMLIGDGSRAALGLGVGLLLLVATLAYLAYRPETVWLGGFYLDMSRLTPLLVAAVVLIPLSELFFRAFAFPTLSRRYNPTTAVLLSGGLSALVFGTPVLLLLAFGLALAELFRRHLTGMPSLTAQVVLHLGLLVAVAFVPWARALFL